MWQCCIQLLHTAAVAQPLVTVGCDRQAHSSSQMGQTDARVTQGLTEIAGLDIDGRVKNGVGHCRTGQWRTGH